jgi:anti-sigma-K factor RskA
MPRAQVRGKHVTILDNKAFEYVIGTLPLAEREDFQNFLFRNRPLEVQVNFWEEQLQALHCTENTLQPTPNTWLAINAATNTPHILKAAPVRSRWLNWLPWNLTAVLSFSLLLVLCLGQLQFKSSGIIPIDYVAILSDDAGQAKLTTVVEGDSQRMWLRWQKVALENDQDLQIWALSKTDNEIRSIAIIDNQDTDSIQLSDANWRLIKDSATLILTAEEEGGSALDEPSEMIVAQGICVRLTKKDKTT